MKKVYGICGLSLVASLFLFGCSQSKQTEKTTESSRVVVRTVTCSSSSDVERVSENDSLAEEFINRYISQHFDLKELADKEKYLRSIAGDNTLDRAISDIVALQVEAADYLETKEVKNYASVTLLERDVDAVQVYKNGSMYFVDVKFTESSPAYAGEFERRKQYTFELEESKVVSFEEVLNR